MSAEFTITEIMNNFELFILGDLEFEYQVMGMNNSDKHHCIICEAKMSEFNQCHENFENIKRTKESMCNHLNEFERRKIKNHIEKPQRSEW